MPKDLINPDHFFVKKFGIESGQLEKTMSKALGNKIDYMDLYFEYRTNDSISLEEGIIKKANKNISQGVGVRATSEEKTGFAYSDEISIKNIEIAANTAKYITSSGALVQKTGLPGRTPLKKNLYAIQTPISEIPFKNKIEMMQKMDQIARNYDPRIKKVMVSFSSEHKIIYVVTSEGISVGDVQPLSRLNITCIAEEGTERQVGTFGGGGRNEFSYFINEHRYEHYAKEAARQAILNLSAVSAPAGTMDVVLAPGWPGILLHEAIGHGLEGDFNRKKTSAFSDKIGQKVASSHCTIVDDGTIPGRRGSLNIDDEGTETQRTVLIENGVLKRYLQDKLNARLMNMAPTGNGRRESYADIPLPRMTNTYMLPGKEKKEEIISSVKRGLYAVSFGGGQVDITNGKFVFSASEAYLIEDGKVTRPVKGATLIGNGPDVLTRVSMVGDDLELDSGIGTCGKDGQSVPVGVGLPTIKINGLTVGGSAI
ncbi:MAG: metalloprotease TldD [Nitrospirae bacterium]|nr:metalloprotease TldD [Nitrospirota bacterium]MBI3595025.1 metalloprotease TldD [Nitrospirota bacterium]